MNRTFVSVFLSVVLIAGLAISAFSEARWVSLDGTSNPAKPSVVVLSSTDTETTIRVTLHGFWVREVMEDGQTFQQLSLPGYATTLDIGKPAMPVISELVSIPGSANVSASVLDAEETTFAGYRVHPFQTPLRETETRVQFDIDHAAYQVNAFYPDQVELGGPGIWRDLRVVSVRISPIRFNPVTNELTACPQMIIRLDYTGVSSVNVKQSLKRPIADNYDRMYRQSVINYPHTNIEIEPAADAAYDLLIIADDAYISNIAPLADYKNSIGLATNVVPVSTVGSTYSSIKSYISDEYSTNSIRYVLLVGDEGDIPAYTGYGFFSDYYYSLLEGSDDFADIAIGRFSVTNSTQVDNMVSKSITFENNPPAGEWLDKSLLVANWELAPDKYQGCKEEVRTAAETASGTYSVLYPNFTTAYGASYANGGDEATNADVIAYINDGQRLVNYRGHGDETSWQYWNTSGQYFRVSDVASIDNGAYTPVVFSIACLNANLSYSQTTLAEAFTQGDDAAVAYLGASDPSYTTPNHDYDKQLYAIIFDEGVNAIGDASNEASVRVINLWGSYGITNARMYLWLGDPSLQLINNAGPVPAKPNLLSPDDGAYFDAPAVVDLDWDDAALATYYHVQVDNNSDFSSPVAEDANLGPSAFQTPELAQSAYYWRVRGGNENGYGPWSDVWTIMVGITMEAPVLVSPADGSRLKNVADLPLEWTRIDGVAGYTIEISMDPSFASVTQSGYSELCTNGTCLYRIDPPLMPGTYYWRVKAVDEGWPWSEVWSFRLQGRVFKDGMDADAAGAVELHANYPNPFNPSTGISFTLPRAGHVRLSIFDIRGRRVSKLVDRNLEAGHHTFEWDGGKYASGIYLYRLETEESVATRKMVLLK